MNRSDSKPMLPIHRNRDEMAARAREIVECEARAIQQISGQLSGELYEIAGLLSHCKGHVLTTGTGTSRFVAQRFAHLLCCCGVPSLFINAADSLHGGAGAITPDDVIFIISKGGQSSEINQFAQIARSRGAQIVSLTEKPDSPLGKLSHRVYRIISEGEIDPFGMIATGSSLINCAVCDVLCILLLEEKGYTRAQFGETHPGGAVGIKLEQELT